MVSTQEIGSKALYILSKDWQLQGKLKIVRMKVRLYSVLVLLTTSSDTLPKGIEALQQAVIISKETQDLNVEGVSLVNLAAAYLAQGDSQKSDGV